MIEGGPSDDRYPTVYFRREFVMPNPVAFSALELGMQRDDGAVVYLNGVEIVRGKEFTDARPGTLLRSGRDTETVAVPAGGA